MESLDHLGVMANLEKRALRDLQAEKGLVDQEESRASQVNQGLQEKQVSLELRVLEETRERPATQDYQALVGLKAPRVHLVQSVQKVNRGCQAGLVIEASKERREIQV